MKEQRIISFKKNDGTRTSITLSSYQLYVLDRLAKYLGWSRAKFLNNVFDTYAKNGGNMSTCVKDVIIATLIKMLILNGVEL